MVTKRIILFRLVRPEIPLTGAHIRCFDIRFVGHRFGQNSHRDQYRKIVGSQ